MLECSGAAKHALDVFWALVGLVKNVPLLGDERWPFSVNPTTPYPHLILSMRILYAMLCYGRGVQY